MGVRRARTAAAGLATAVAVGCWLLTGGPAVAATAHDAQQRADALLAQVHQLDPQVAAAQAAYDDALGGLATAVTRNILAGEAADDAAQAAGAARRRLDDRVRGLYMAGGQAALVASMLDADGVDDLFSRAAVAQRLVAVDHAATEQADRAASDAQRRADDASRVVVQRVTTERSVAVAYDRLQSLLTRQQALLDQARLQAVELAAVEAAERHLAAEQAAAAAVAGQQVRQAQVLPASPAYLRLYRDAAPTCPGLSWTVLAAIGQVESGHGRDTSTSSAGAMGPMQFLPSTFAAVGVDGDGDRRIDIMDPADAIFSAARYLCQNGAGLGGQHLYDAIWNYNHADWYVQLVLTLAQEYAGGG